MCEYVNRDTSTARDESVDTSDNSALPACCLPSLFLQQIAFYSLLCSIFICDSHRNPRPNPCHLVWGKMESLAALSLAGTVIQFVEFATKVAKGSHEIFQSVQGLIIEHEQFSALTEDLQEICDELQKPIPGDQLTSWKEKRLQSLAEECAAGCKRLQDVLSELRVKEGGKQWKGLVAAVKAIGK